MANLLPNKKRIRGWKRRVRQGSITIETHKASENSLGFIVWGGEKPLGWAATNPPEL